MLGVAAVGTQRQAEKAAVSWPALWEDPRGQRTGPRGWSSCSAGGNGAAPGIPAVDGGTVARPNNAGDGTSGAGGGGLGRLRINTRDGVYSKASTAVEAAATSAGVLSTR